MTQGNKAVRNKVLLSPNFDCISFLFSQALGGLQIPDAHMKAERSISVRFKDVKGIDEVKEELQEIVEYLKKPSKFTSLGAKLPKGISQTGIV